MDLELDEWQKEILDEPGDVCLVSGRQIGKSTVMAIDAAEYAVHNGNKQVLMISSVERQAYELYQKTLNYLFLKYKKFIKQGADRPTLSKVKLKNGSVILCLPTGLDGHGIRGYTIDRLYADEAHFIPEDVWNAVTPMLIMTGGKQRLFSTPHGNSGYFYNCCMDTRNFITFHRSTEEVIRERKISATWTEMQRDDALKKLEYERNNKTSLVFAQEYLGRFMNELRQVFSDEAIKRCMQLKRPGIVNRENRFYLGVDIARMGEDETTFEIIDRTNKEMLVHVENQITKRTLLTDTFNRILQLDRIYDFKQIFIDDGGMGVGVFDMLLANEQTRRKTVAINNSTRPLDKDELRKKRLLKEDIYNNLVMLMEQDKIRLLDDPEIFQSLKSVQFEITDKGVKYFGNYTHIADGLVRAAWSSKDKSLNIYIY